MNKLNLILEELSEIEAENFISACSSKFKSTYGVPRFVHKKNTDLKLSDVKNFFAKDINVFKEIDDKYYGIIEEPYLEDFLSNLEFEIVYDFCRIRFDQEDDFFNFLPNKLKKLFNLNERNCEKRNFMLSNSKHLGEMNCITTKVIFDKLNQVWAQKWQSTSSYLNDNDERIVNNIISA